MSGEISAASSVRGGAPMSVWHNLDFLLLWSGRSVSALGSNVSAIAFPLLILSLTNSPALAGIGGGLGAVSTVLLGLPAGALADRWDKKRVMVLCETGRSVALGSIPLALWTGHTSLAQLYAANIIEGTLRVFYTKASIVARTMVVPPEQYAATSAQDEASYYTAGLIGPSLGGALYQMGRTFPFVADAASYLVSAASLLLMRADLGSSRTGQRRRVSAEVREGLTWVWRAPLVRSVSVLQAGHALTGSGLGLLAIVVARQQHASPTAIGLIFSLSAVGGIVGAILGGQTRRVLSFGRTMLVVTWSLALLWPAYAVAHAMFALGLVTAAIYLLSPIKNVALVSYEVALIPPDLRGRVLGVSQFLPDTMALIGPPLMGFALQSVGVTPTAVGAWAVALLTALFTTLNPALRDAPAIPKAPPSGRG